jgi:hypothetical protein
MKEGELSEILVGRRVTDRQLAGNSFSIWFDTEEGSDTGWSVWLEPTWHLVGPDGVIAGSRQAQDEEEETGWKAVTDAIDILIGHVLEAIDIDPRTGDLVLTFSGGLVARTFVSDPREDYIWRVREFSSDRYVVGAARQASPDRPVQPAPLSGAPNGE